MNINSFAKAGVKMMNNIVFTCDAEAEITQLCVIPTSNNCTQLN